MQYCPMRYFGSQTSAQQVESRPPFLLYTRARTLQLHLLYVSPIAPSLSLRYSKSMYNSSPILPCITSRPDSPV